MSEKPIQQKLSWVEQVVPVSPATRPNGLIGLVSRLNLAAGNEPFALPLMKAFVQQIQDSLLAIKVS